MTTPSRFAGPGVLAVALAGAALPAQSAIEEVIVTAQKRSESAQDIPIAVTALTDEDLAERRIISSYDIANSVPNLQWNSNDATSVSNVFIRGVGDFSFHTNQVGAVGLYADDVTLGSPLLSNFALFDLERIEVLRGPQNTLYGRNTTGGAVQFVSRKPRLDDGVNGDVSVTAGNEDRFDVQGALGGPLGDSAAARVAVAAFTRGDYLDNINLSSEEGGFERYSGRAQFLWAPGDTTSVLVNVHGGKFDGDANRFKQVGLSDPQNPGFSDCPFLSSDKDPGNGCSDQTGFVDSGDFTRVAANRVNELEIDSIGGLLQFEWDLPAFKVTALTGYESAESQRAEDDDSGPSSIFDLHQETDTSQWSQELRLVSPSGEAVRWIAGLFYLLERSELATVVRRANPILSDAFTPGAPIPEAGVPTFMPHTRFDQDNTVWSGYGQLDYRLTDRTVLTGGLRYTYERKDALVRPGAVADAAGAIPASRFVGRDLLEQLLVGATEVGPGPLPPQCPPPFPLTSCFATIPFDESWEEWGGRISLAFEAADDSLLYAGIARGFKSGGVSVAPLDFIVGAGGSVIDPEFLWTYEIGLKSQWLGDTLQLNAAAFWNEWKDQQLFLIVSTPLGPNPVLTNVPESRSRGVEFDLQWNPGAGWLLAGSLGLLDSEVVDAGSIQNVTSGNKLVSSPEVTFNGLIRKDWPLRNGAFGLQASGNYVGSQEFDLGNDPLLGEDSRWLLDASATYRFGADDRYEIMAWGKNLTSTEFCLNRGSLAGLGFGDVVVCTPNEGTAFYGLTFRLSFD